MSLPYTTRITKTNTTPLFFFSFLSATFSSPFCLLYFSLISIFLHRLLHFGTIWIHVCCILSFCVFPSFFFSPCLIPQHAVLFMYGIWTVTTTFDRSSVNSASVHCSRTHKFHFLSIFSLKMGPTALFTHLKIILLQCFQFQQNKFYPNTSWSKKFQHV